MKTFRVVICGLLSVVLFASCGARTETIRPGFEPPVLLTIDTRKPLGEKQQKERIKMARFFRIDVEDGKFVLVNTWDETENAGIARPYYDYMVEVVGIYNDFAAGLDADRRAGYIRSTVLLQEALPQIIYRDYIHFSEDYEVVIELTPKLAERVGYTKEEFEEVYEYMLMDKAFRDDFIADLRDEGLEEELHYYHDAFAYGSGHSLFFSSQLYMDSDYDYDEVEVLPALLELNRRYMPAERQ